MNKIQLEGWREARPVNEEPVIEMDQWRIITSEDDPDLSIIFGIHNGSYRKSSKITETLETTNEFIKLKTYSGRIYILWKDKQDV